MIMKYILFTCCFLFSLALSAQQAEVAISYEIDQITESEAKMHLYLHSLTDQEQAIRAINFSLALPEGCASITGQQSIFSDAWTDYLQEVQLIDELDLNYNNWHYSSRYQFGAADPGLPGTTAIIAPAQGQAALPIMTISMEGSCVQQMYVEQQQENPINQMGDADVMPLGWAVIHPETELEIEAGLTMNIFPNPTPDRLHIELDGTRDQAIHFAITNIEGKQIASQQLEAQEEGKLSFDLSDLAAAMYMLQITQEGKQTQLVKVIKK